MGTVVLYIMGKKMALSVISALAPVVQTLDSAIHWITIQWISNWETNYCTFHWIKIYPSDSAIHLLNNWGQLVFYINKIILTLVTQGLPSSLLCRPKRVSSLLV